MNDEHNPDIDKFLDDIIFSKAAGADLAELMRNRNREELLNELILHQTAASIIQRHEVISQVNAIHNEFLEKKKWLHCRRKFQCPGSAYKAAPL